MNTAWLFYLYLFLVSNYFPLRPITEASLLNKDVDHLHQMLFELTSVRYFVHGYGCIMLLLKATNSFVAGMSNPSVGAARSELRGFSSGRKISNVNRMMMMMIIIIIIIIII